MANNVSPPLGSKPEDRFAIEFKINSEYLTKDFCAFVKNTLQGQGENTHPFPHFQLKDFIQNIELVRHLQKELKEARYYRNENDLNSLSQTIDLKSFDVEKYPYLCGFRRFMGITVRDFLSNATGFELNSQVAITGSKYSNTDLLLPHDDSLDFRKIAFVLYLTPDWKEEYGGELALYNADLSTNRPTTIAKTLLPDYGSFLFFPVSTNTWHSVREILSKDHQRLSLNGWFHADDAKAAAPPLSESPIKRIQPTLETTLSEVNRWINPSYLSPSEQKNIKRRFARKSELYLEHFLNPEMYSKALEELRNTRFETVGPPNRRNVGLLAESSLNGDGPLSRLLTLFRSEAMALLLTQWSGLKIYNIKALNASSSPEIKKPRLSGDLVASLRNSSSTLKETDHTSKPVEMVSNIYRFGHGSYTMADQQMAADAASNGYCLDALLFLSDFETWPSDSGGYVSYIAVEDPNEVGFVSSVLLFLFPILKVPPRPNCLAVVFREPEILSFTKYINVLAGSNFYYLLNCSFFGAASDGESESEDSLDSTSEDFEDDFEFEGEIEDDEQPLDTANK